MARALFIIGTRPEAIKLCPVVLQFREHAPDWETHVCVTAQHRGMLDQVLNAFGIVPEYDLNVMRSGQNLFQSTTRILQGLEQVLATDKPDMIFVQGDTTTTFCGALAGFYKGIQVAHIEAGLRTGDFQQPFPEEMNRVLTSRLATLHFAPTTVAASNLVKEGVVNGISITGNTGIDALLLIRNLLESGRVKPAQPVPTDARRKTVLVTAHRRESFGDGFVRICTALKQLARRDDVDLIFPVHPNPNVRRPVEDLLGNHERIRLIDPLDYVPFVDLMRRCHFILTDSGGVQEEAPSLGKAVLVMREKTERPEAVTAGTARLVGTDVDRILEESTVLLDDAVEYARRSKIHNPYGDGNASKRILRAVRMHVEPAAVPRERGFEEQQPLPSLL